MSDFSAKLQYSPCLHLHVVVVSTGSSRFSHEEVADDIQERLQCLDCLKYLSETGIRAAWVWISFDEFAAIKYREDLQSMEIEE